MANIEYGILSEPSNYTTNSGNWELGWNFTAAKDFYLYGFRVKTAQAVEKTCRLWDASNNEIAVAALTSAVGKWVEVLLDEPVLLEAGKEYTISTWSDNLYYYNSNSYFTFNTAFLNYKNGKAGRAKGAYPNTYTETFVYPLIDCIISDDPPPIKRYLIRDNGIIYTVVGGALSELSGELNAELFILNGAESIPDGALLLPLSAPEVLCWTDGDEVPKLTATVQGVPVGEHSIISDNIRVGHSSIYGITSVEAVASEGATFLLSFDGGLWMSYNASSDSWEASDVGMTPTELVAVPVEAWSSAINSATYMQLKATIDGVDTVTQIKFNFNNESPIG